MKRPFACIGFGAFVAATVTALFGYVTVVVAVICLCVSAVLLALRINYDDYFEKIENKKVGMRITSAIVFLLCGVVTSAFYFSFSIIYADPLIDKYNEKNVVFSGIITAEPYTQNASTSCDVRIDNINGKHCRINTKMYSNKIINGHECDRITARAVLKENSSSSLKYMFIGQVKNNGVFCVEKSNSLNIEKNFAYIRKYIKEYFAKNLSYDESALCTAMVIGEKEFLPSEMRDIFNDLGISHLIVVSGLHLSSVMGILYVICTSRIKNKYLSCLLQFSGVFLFALMSGFGYSVRRAFIMSAVLIFSQVFESKSDSLNTLGLAAAILSLNPFSAGDIGLLWSFSCTFAVVSGFSYVKRKKVKYPIIFTAFMALLGSIPFIILVTKTFSPYTILANLLTVPVTVFVVVGGIFAVVFSKIPILSDFFLLISGMVTKYLIFITRKIYALPCSKFKIDRSIFVIWLLISIAVLIIAYTAFENRHLYKIVFCVSGAVLVVISGYTVFAGKNEIVVSVLDGGGMNVVLKEHGNAFILSSFGGSISKVVDYLSDYDILFMADVAPPETKNRNYRKIMDNCYYHIENVVVEDYAALSKEYSWYEYKGGTVGVIDREYILKSENFTVDIFLYGDTVFEYICAYGTEILLYEGGSESIPTEFLSPDIVIVPSENYADKFSEDADIIISDETNDGKGNIDIRVNKSGEVDICRQ